MKLTKSKLRQIIREELLNERIKGPTELVTVGINAFGNSHKKQVKQIKKVLENFPGEVYDNVVVEKPGAFISITCKKEDKTGLVQYLRNVSNKVDGWEVLR